jgi:hypothetical protein
MRSSGGRSSQLLHAASQLASAIRSDVVKKPRYQNWLGRTLVIAVLLALLSGAVLVGRQGWVSAGDVVMPPWGWLMMGLGIVITLLLGWGLMALIFYSSRAGFDGPPGISTKSEGDPSRPPAGRKMR